MIWLYGITDSMDVNLGVGGGLLWSSCGEGITPGTLCEGQTSW